MSLRNCVEMALVTGGAGCDGPAEASLTCPALTWTVRTLTGRIGSEEPGMAGIACDWITPLVSGAGSGFGCAGGRAAVAAATSDARAVGRAAAASTGGGGAVDVTWMAP